MRHLSRPSRVLAVSTVLLALVAAACVEERNAGPGKDNSQGGGTVKIGLIAPFSGIASSIGRNMREGMQIAVDELNAAGGVLGNQIEIVARDNEFDPAKTAQVARELIQQEHVSMIVGPPGTTSYLAMQRLIADAHVLDMPIVTDPFLKEHIDPYTFRIMIPDDVELNVLVDYAAKRFSKIAIIAEDTKTGDSMIDITREEIASQGKQLVDVESFDVEALDLTPIVLKTKQSGADAVILGTHIGPWAARVLTAADTLGYSPQWLGLAGLTTYTFADLARDLVVGTVFVAPANPVLVGQNSTPNAESFYKEYVDRYFPDGTRSETGANKVIGAAFLTYDGVKMWAAAAEQAGSTESDAVKDVFNSGFDFGPADSSANLSWHYDAGDHEGFHQTGAWFYQWVKGSDGIEFKFLGDAAKLAA